MVYWENGFRNVTNSARPIEKFEDFNGIKLRVMPNPVFIDTFKRMGANAVPLPFSELSLRWKPRRSTAGKPYNTILSSKFYEVQKFLSVTNHVYSPWIVTASKRWWDGLSETEQGIIMAAAQKARDAEREDTVARRARPGGAEGARHAYQRGQPGGGPAHARTGAAGDPDGNRRRRAGAVRPCPGRSRKGRALGADRHLPAARIRRFRPMDCA